MTFTCSTVLCPSSKMVYFDAYFEWCPFQIIYLESEMKCHLLKTTSLETFQGSGVSQMSQILQFIANFTALLGKKLGSVCQAR